MTLIAAIRVGECPILLGDLLISSIIAPGRPISLPTVGDLPEDLALGGTHHVTGTAQKICIVNPRLAVAWAGREIFAKYVIRKMGRCFSGRIINQGSLEKFFNSQDTEHLQESQMICWYGNGKGLNSFGANTTNIDTDNFGHCHVGGTGTGELIDLLYSEMQYRAHGAPNALANGVVTALMLASQILANEVVTGANLTSYYGGGMEIATFFDNKYQKVGDILHLFWRYDETKRQNAIELVPILYKLDYLKNNLIIRRILFGEDLTTATRYDTFVRTPMMRSVPGGGDSLLTNYRI